MFRAKKFAVKSGTGVTLDAMPKEFVKFTAQGKTVGCMAASCTTTPS